MKEKTNSQIELIEFNSSYDQPTFEVKRNKDYINFGSDNLAPDYMLSLLDQSPVHSNLVYNIASMISGEGFIDKNSAAFKNENGEENLDQILHKLSFDAKLYGAFALSIRWSRDLSTPTVDYLDVGKVRLATPDVALNGIQSYWISSDWKNYRKEAHAPELFQGFSKLKKSTKPQVLYMKLEGVPSAPYALPTYWSAREYIELQQHIISYHLNNIRHGSSVKTLVKLNGSFSSAEESEKFSALWKKFEGDQGHRTAILQNAENISIENLDEGLSDERFQSLDQLTSERIKQAHGVTGKGAVFGISSEQGTTFNSNRDQLNEFDLMQNLRIRPLQLKIEQTFSNLFEQEINIQPLLLSEGSYQDEDQDNLLGNEGENQPIKE